MNTSELFTKILERPPLYIGHASVILAEAFINGYGFAKHNEDSNFHDSLYSGFSRWVADHFGFGHSHSWSQIIAFMGKSEEAAFRIAGELWNKYKIEMEALQ